MKAKSYLAPDRAGAGGARAWAGLRYGRQVGLWIGLTGLVLWTAACAPGNRPTSRKTLTAPAAPAPTVAMMPAEALGLWQSSFGAVKIEADAASGLDRLMGVWLYQRAGEDVIGYFEGTLRGNVLELVWHEPALPEDLVGAGYLVFEPGGGQFTGKWWTRDQTRSGAWTGRRPAADAPSHPSQGSGDVREDGSSDAAGPEQPGEEAGMPGDSADPAAGDRLPW